MGLTNYKPKLLKLADYNDPILHNKTEPVKFPLSIEDQQIIADMIYSIQPAQLKAAKAPWESAAGMAANQWGINKSIFLYCPSGDTIKGLTVVINPSYEAIGSILSVEPHVDTAWEGCFSVPLASGNISRNIKIKIKYQDESGLTIEKILTDWDARVWQHENDHLNGHLYDDPRTGKCLEKKTFNNLSEYEEFYEDIRTKRRN